MPRYPLLFIFLSVTLHGQAETVYKYVDEPGAVAFSDTAPQHRRYEIVNIFPPARSSSLAEARARHARLQAATDELVEARRTRERERLQLQSRSSIESQPYSLTPFAYLEPAPLFYGYSPPYRDGLRADHWRAGNHLPRSVDRIDPPPVRRRLPAVPVIPRNNH